MATRTCPICQTDAEPLTDSDGKQFCRSCDLQLPPPEHAAASAPTRAKVVTARPVADDDTDDRPRKASPRRERADEPPAERGPNKMIAGLAILIGGFVTMVVFFALVIVIKTSDKPTPTSAPKSLSIPTWKQAQMWATKAEPWSPPTTRYIEPPKPEPPRPPSTRFVDPPKKPPG